MSFLKTTYQLYIRLYIFILLALSYTWCSVPYKSHRLSNKNPSVRQRKLSFELLINGHTRDSQHNLGLLSLPSYDCLPQVEGKILLQKTPDTLKTQLRGELTWKPPPWRLTLKISRGTMQVFKEEK